MNLRVLLAVAVLALAVPVSVRGQAAPRDDVSALVARLEAALAAPDRTSAFLDLSALPGGDASARAAAREMALPGPTRVIVRERDRRALQGALPGEGYRLTIELFSEQGDRARIATWQVDVRLARRLDAEPRPWRIVRLEQLTSLDGLHRLRLDSARQYAARNLVVSATDLRLELQSGNVFVAEVAEGVTAMVLQGRGQLRFTPRPEPERLQLKIFSGSDTLATSFDQALIRLSARKLEEQVAMSALEERAPDPRDLKRAQAFFEEHIHKTFSLDLGDLTRDRWSLLPSGRDFVAEIHTRRYDVLTYARASAEPEDIALFDRENLRRISSYASEEQLARRGRFYNEDLLVDYDVLDYDVDVEFSPQREWIDGRVTLQLRVRAAALTTVTLRLDEALAVQSVSSPVMGRLLFVRVLGQDNLIVNLPGIATKGAEFELTVAYAGHLAPQPPEREAIVVQPARLQSGFFEPLQIPMEERFVYSNRTHWYPRSTVSDYATARLQLTVPDGYGCIASGVPLVGTPTRVPGEGQSAPGMRFVYYATQPVRYLSFIVSRFVEAETADVPIDVSPESPAAGIGEPDSAIGVSPLERAVALSVQANPRQVSRGRALWEPTAEIIRFYSALMGGAPYSRFTLALTESDLPGGHSPGYFAVLNQALPTSPLRWRNDPVSFSNFPSFFLAHEIAHQWWGQGVGWQNYHEQWLSEGLAQYFAVLYAAHERGDDVLVHLMRQMRRWAMRYEDEGPIYLGYRLGHIKGDSRIFRAILYNKSAVVLHMLRRLVGDEAFFTGLRRFYTEHLYRKAGSEDLRRTMEAVSGRSLERFFERWIYGATLPRLRFSYRVGERAPDGTRLVTLRFEQRQSDLFDVPVTVTLVSRSGDSQTVVVPVTDKVVEFEVAVAGDVRDVKVNDDSFALAEIDR